MQRKQVRCFISYAIIGSKGGILQIGKVPSGENHPDMNVPAMLEATKHGWFRGVLIMREMDKNLFFRQSRICRIICYATYHYTKSF